jgi:exodeoxyribonuclease V beta subunit
MSAFDVLSRAESVHRPLLLEASAGTGKTFAIENIVLRLLVEIPDGKEEALNLNQILVVTFTRAAARDLKVRIRSTLENSLTALHHYLGDHEAPLPDCLLAIIEAAPENSSKLKRSLEQALLNFEQAQIFTIHRFCWNMLKNYAIEADVSLDFSSREEGQMQTRRMMQAIRDFMRTELLPELYHPSQIKILLKREYGDVDKLINSLYKELTKGIDVAPFPSFADLLIRFREAMHSIKLNWNFEADKIFDDFIKLAPSYKGLYSKSREMHPEVLKKVMRFTQLFDQTSWNEEDFAVLVEDGLFLQEALDPSQLASRKVAVSKDLLNYPQFIPIIEKELGSIAFLAREGAVLFARLVRECQLFWNRCRKEEEFFGHQDLLIEMKRALASPLFIEKIRMHYSAAIVDEFQDTDPVQWEIFHTLFCDISWKGYFHIVGDPKQSIYAFRQADIYTYLEAAKALGPEAHATLDSNFRSQPILIEALNELFKSVHELFPLPRVNSSLPFHPVNAGKKAGNSIVEKSLTDDAPLQFWTVKADSSKRSLKATIHDWERQFFFPAIAKEILQLQRENGIAFNRFAILVSDKNQSQEIEKYLKACGIPIRNQKGSNLAKSPAVEAMRDLIHGILHYRQSALKLALGGRLICMCYQDFLTAENYESSTRLFKQCSSLRQILIDQGFPSFYSYFMQSCWHSQEQSVLEMLLQQKDGFAFYSEWQDIADLLMAEEASSSLSAEGLVQFLDEFKQLSFEQDEPLISSFDAEAEEVTLLTTHSSKGLEFDIIFALGMLKITPAPDEFVLIKEGNRQWREPLSDRTDPRYLKHCEEIDAEKMRQFYVALTRAKYRVYIPVPIIDNRKEQLQYGTASPIDLFLAKCGASALNYKELYQNINVQNGEALNFFLKECKARISQIFLKENSETLSFKNAAADSLLLIPPPTISISHSPRFIQSFSTLHAALSDEPKEGWIEDPPPTPHDFLSEIKSEHTLPSGAETGVLLHRILEEISFQRVKEANHSSDLIKELEPFLQNTLYEPWKEVISSIIFKALTAVLSHGKSQFRLVDLHPKKMYREADFFYPCEPEIFEHIGLKPGFLKGVMDLFFEHEERYYLLDWKSNWLGPSLYHYQEGFLKDAMRVNGYFLQARIYIEALKRYLCRFDNRPFTELFGGTYYLFLRGVQNGSGIFYFAE